MNNNQNFRSDLFIHLDGIALTAPLACLFETNYKKITELISEHNITINIDELLDYNELQVNKNIVMDNLNSELEIVEIKTILNSSIETESISFFLNDVIAFSGKTDPNGDNWDANFKPNGTELNESYDLGELSLDMLVLRLKGGC